MGRIRRSACESGLGILAAVVILAGDGLSAQPAFPLRAVEFEGNANFSSDDLTAVCGLEIGQAVRKPDFDRALRKLSETGLFESLRYRFEPLDGGYRLTVSVQELAELYPVRFQGLGVPAADLAQFLRGRLPLYAGLVPGGGPVVRTMVNALQAWWREQGGEGEIVADLVPASEGGFDMLVGPQRETSNIAFATFRNTGDVDTLELQRAFNKAAVGEPYSEARLLELLRHNARRLYTERGYMNVQFCPCGARPDPDSAGVLVEIEVRQGEVYLFGDVRWPEPLPIDEDSLAKVSQIGSGQVANMKAAYDTMAAISEGMKRQGYMKAHARFDERIDQAERLVHLDIEIRPGEQYVFSRLAVQGLDILSEPAVRKRWGMQPGQPFDIRYPAYFLDRVKADAMFEGLGRTSWSIDVDEAAGRVDVTLVFSGVPPERR
ncbi:MAG: hypothetical protein OXD30_11750 [Bryobacterales bacterium]|nr:hypothetical protein [Bryobacterales bacterium]